MKIMIVATEDHLGAGKAAHRLYEVFKRKGHEACMLVKHKTIGDSNIIEVNERKSIAARVLGKLKKVSGGSGEIKTDPNYYFFGIHDPELKLNLREIKKKLPFQPELIVITWISKFINAEHVYELHKMTGARVIAYPMDMSLFTGGCHYAWNSTGFQNNCDPCPAILSDTGKHLPSEILISKQRYFSLAKVKAIAPSAQVQEQLSRSTIFKGQQVEKVLLPVDENIFNTSERKNAKPLIGLPEDSIVIFFGTAFTTEKRKGIHLFIEALQMLHTALQNTPSLLSKVIVMIAGNKKEDPLFQQIPFTTHFPGYINDDKILSRHYQASDLFISSSLQDAGPMMINEAIMCGTPVIAFNIGVADDLIADRVSGYKIKLGDTAEMASRMEEIVRKERDPAFNQNISKLGSERSSYSAFNSQAFLQ